MTGWMNKATAELVAHLVAEKAITTELRVQLATERARFDWLAHHVNELKLERAELYRRIGVYLPVPTIARTGGVPAELPGMDAGYLPTSGKVADLGDLLAKARDLKEQAEQTRQAGGPKAPDTGGAGGGGFDGFEDIGDEAAKLIGADRDAVGNLIFKG